MRAKNSRFGILVIINGVVLIAGAAILKIVLWYIVGINFLLLGVANLIGISVVSDRNGEALKYRKYGKLIFWGVMAVTAFLIWQAIRVKLL